jgi:hypothetical protein
MVDITEISAMLAAAGVLVAVVYYILDMRHQTKVRDTDLAIRMNPWMAVSGADLTDVIAEVWSLEFKDYNDFIKKYGPFTLRKPEQKAIQMLLNYFEGVGLLLKRNLMDINFAWDLWGNSYFLVWEKLKPLVEGLRKQYGMADAWSFFEYLYNETKKREQQLQQKGVNSG